MMTFIALIVIIAIAIFVAALLSNHLDEVRIANSTRASDKEKRELEHIACDEFNRILPAMGGAPTLFYSEYGALRKSGAICACLFEQDKKLWLFDKLISVGDIEDIYVEEQRFITREKIYDEEPLRAGKVLKRAAVGGFLFGPAGAALGAATTGKDKRCIAVDKTISSDYDLIIVIKNMHNAKLRFLDDISELNLWTEELQKITGINPRIVKLDDIDTDFINEY